MKTIPAFTFGLALAAFQSHAQTPPADALVIKHANIVDGIANAARLDQTVVVANGRIVSIGSAPATETQATVLDLKGHWLLPGFVDAHSHIADLAAARRALLAGTTSARDLGVDHFADVGIRELNHAGVLSDVPDIVAAGYHVRPRPSDAFFIDFPQMAAHIDGVRGEEALREMVRAMASRKVDVIKVMATERAGLPETDPRYRVFNDEELAAVVNEAHAANLMVAAHAHGDEGAAAAIRAGVRTIEHGTWVSDGTLKLMKQKNVCLVPTLVATQDISDPTGDYDDPLLQIRGRAMVARSREMVATAWNIGVTIAGGADTGYSPRSTNRMGDEVVALSNTGLPAMDAIKAATSVSAQCLGIGRRTGSIQVGYEADFIVVERDPLTHIEGIREVLAVVNNGRVALNRMKIDPRQ